MDFVRSQGRRNGGDALLFGPESVLPASSYVLELEGNAQEEGRFEVGQKRSRARWHSTCGDTRRSEKGLGRAVATEPNAERNRRIAPLVVLTVRWAGSTLLLTAA